MFEGSAPDGAAGTPTPRRRLSRPVIAAAGGLGLAVGVAVGAAALAGAATDPGSGSTTTPPGASTAPAPPPGPGGGHPGGRGHGPGGFGRGIHGEFTVPAPNGGYETLANQIGQVTAVSSTSITVKSEDNVEKTYVVDEGTVVDAGRDGIADVKKDETVRIEAVVTGTTSKAVQIEDVTSLKNHRSTWAPRRPARGGAANPGTTPPTTTG